MLSWLMISVVIPAFNEEKYLPATLAALAAELAFESDHEILVVDNESTDSTREIATAFGATIVDEPVHTISAVRNAGGLAALGDLIVFLDADTLVPGGLFQKIS